MATEGYLTERNGTIYVGAFDKERDYNGPQAEVTLDEKWLYIVTCRYEGVAMLNAEAAPFLIKAIQKAMRKAAKK